MAIMSCWKYLHVWRYLSGFSGDVLIRKEQRNTNAEQIATGYVEEKKMDAKILLPFLLQP